MTGLAGAVEGKGDTVLEAGITGGRRDSKEEPLHTDTLGAKVTEGPRASEEGAGRESPVEDG